MRVLRVPKLPETSVELQVLFHVTVVCELFGSFAPRMKLTRLLAPPTCVSTNSTLFAQTTNLMGPMCVELKPKYPDFKGGIFSPFFSKDSSVPEIFPSLSIAANNFSKRYLRIHSAGGLSDDQIIGLVTEVIGHPEMRILFAKLETLQAFGDNQFASHAHELNKQISHIYNCVDIFDSIHEFTNSATFHTEIHTGPGNGFNTPHTNEENPINTFNTGTINTSKEKWINTFLAGRMARDVSLMINLSKGATADSRLGAVLRLNEGWNAAVGIVDTDLKPRSKIALYYASALLD